MENETHKYLYSLKQSDYQIVDGEPNIIGWEVKSETGAYIGKTVDLLFESDSNAVRYLIIDLSDNGMSLNDKKVMIPIGIAHLHEENDEVTLPNIHFEQFSALPPYNENNVNPETEIQVRDIIGSPAALRIEEQIVKFDQKNFYDHHHFDKKQFYKRDRNAEQLTIHDLVENSKAHDLHAADEDTGQGTHHNEHKSFHPGDHEIKPWLQPGASHNQGGDNDKKDDDTTENYLSGNRPI